MTCLQTLSHSGKYVSQWIICKSAPSAHSELVRRVRRLISSQLRVTHRPHTPLLGSACGRVHCLSRVARRIRGAYYYGRRTKVGWTRAVRKSLHRSVCVCMRGASERSDLWRECVRRSTDCLHWTDGSWPTATARNADWNSALTIGSQPSQTPAHEFSTYLSDRTATRTTN